MGYNEWLGGQNQFQDMHSLHPSYMFNAHEVTNEYNLLGDFLSNSLLDDGAMFNQDMQGIYSDPTLMNSMTNLTMPHGVPQPAQLPPPAQSQAPQGESIQRPTSTVGNDKARETYYMTAADPSGSDPPEERMNKLLKAKYDAGLLKPFNYVKGYARLNQYMEKNLQQVSRQKILRQLDKFRPKFRERMQSLTDIELILVEMWFERSLMEYDRVFASMAIPACCWRRTGEIFRGNNEMAQLIDVPIEGLRDVSLFCFLLVLFFLGALTRLLSAGQARHSRNHRRRPARELLGEIWRHRLRQHPKGHAHQLHLEKPQSQLDGRRHPMLFFIHYPARQSQHVSPVPSWVFSCN